MEYWHLMLASEERATLLPDEARLRAGVRALVAVAPGEHVAFNIVDSHIHQVLVGSRKRAGRIAQATALALRPLLSVPLGPARIKQVTSRSHLEKLVAYVLRQDQGHRTGRHPALAATSFFQDLVGARVLPGLNLRIGDALPRYRLQQALSDVGLSYESLQPVHDETIRRLGARRLVEAAAAACCVGPGLSGRTTRPVSSARRAAASLARKAGIRASEMTGLLSLGERSIRLLASSEGEEILESAVRFRLALEEQVESMPSIMREAPAPGWGEEVEVEMDAPLSQKLY